MQNYRDGKWAKQIISIQHPDGSGVWYSDNVCKQNADWNWYEQHCKDSITK